MAATVPGAAPVTVVFLLAPEAFVEGVTPTGAKG